MLPRLRAERQLALIEAMSVQHMGKSGLGRLLGRYERLAAGPSQPARGRSLSEALQQAGGIPTVYDAGGGE